MSSKFNVLDCDKACLGCIKTYKKKHNLSAGDTFKIPCKGIPKDYIAQSVIDTVPEANPTSMLTMLDPVTWAAEVLDWHCTDPDGSIWKRKTEEGSLDEVTPYIEEKYGELIKQGKSAYNRPYQAEMLRCSSQRKLFRLGRQCIDGSTEITLSDGSIKKIADIEIGDEVITIDQDTLVQDTARVLDKFSSGIKTRYKIHTVQGHEVIVSADHPFLTKEGYYNNKGYPLSRLPTKWVSINNGLKEKSRIAIYSGINLQKNKDNALYTDSHLRILGYFLTDGSFGLNQSAKFTNNSTAYIDEFIADCNILGTKCKSYPKNNGWDVIISNGRNTNNPVRNWLEELGCYGLTFENRELPDLVWSLSRRQVGLLLNRMWSGDGWIEITTRKKRGTNRCSLGIASNAFKYLNKLKALLLKFGINSYVRQEAPSSYTGKRDFYKLHISRSVSIIKFFELVGPIYGKESQSFRGIEIAKISLKQDRTKTENDITWDHVKSITKLKDGEVFDITLDHKHIFVANSSILLKNCGKTESIAVAILHAIFTHQDFKVVVITPYQTQIEVIFSRLEKLIKNSAILKNSIKRNVKAPNYTIELYNGSMIKGYTAGTKSGGNADAVRGTKANMLVFDEADFLNAADMASALAVITNYPDATVWMSSTPTGKRERFYEAAHNPLYREFHYPSYVNPLWNKELEDFFRGELTDIEYQHEIKAEFGEQAQGVYQVSYIEDSLEDYKYEESTRIEGWQYCIGVDWNDIKVGTTIAVVGYNPSTHQFKLVYRTIVSRLGWTQLAACERIAELNRYWLPDWIYIDKGFGYVQAEVLNKFGYDALLDPERGRTHPDARLARIIETYDFGSKVTIKDLFTRQDKEKPSKPFLVENSVRRFERHEIKISKYDKQLQDELRGYIVDHITSTGMPVYKQDNEKAGDHNLDAMNLALVAFTLKMSAWGKVSHTTEIAYTGNLGQAMQPKDNPADVLKQAAATKLNSANSKPIAKTPQLNRSTPIESPDPLHAKMASHNDQRRLWAWPGWESDAPRPVVSPVKNGKGRPRPPSRKMF